MKNRKFAAIVAASALTLSGCAGGTSNTPNDPYLGGTVGGALGAIAGGLAGSQIGGGRGRTVAIIAGSVLGGATGAALGNKLSTQDQLFSQNAATQALENNAPGQTATWQNPQTGNYGYVEPTSQTYQYQAPQGSPYYGTSMGQECRDYKQTIYVEGDQYETATGTACRQPDGSWKIVS